jgi:hypothetical protein
MHAWLLNWRCHAGQGCDRAFCSSSAGRGSGGKAATGRTPSCTEWGRSGQRCQSPPPAHLLCNGDFEPRQLLAAHAVPAKRANQSSSTGRQRECRDSISLIVTTFRPHERTRRADLSSSVITPAAISACIKSRRKDALRYPHALRSGVRIPVL